MDMDDEQIEVRVLCGCEEWAGIIGECWNAKTIPVIACDCILSFQSRLQRSDLRQTFCQLPTGYWFGS